MFSMIDDALRRDDRFELAAILRTFQKQQQRLILTVDGDIQQQFELIRMESNCIHLQSLSDQPQDGSTLRLTAKGQEAKIIFAVRTLSWQQNKVGCQLSGELQSTFAYIQRRINLRVALPLWKKFTLAVPVTSQTEPQLLVLDNFSIGGLGVLSADLPDSQIKPGAVFRKALIDLHEYGQFNVTIEVISVAECGEKAGEYADYSHRLSIRFLKPSLIAQRNLNKVAYALEVNFNRKR